MEIIESKFGNLKEYRLFDKNTNQELVILPERGAMLKSVALKSKDSLFTIVNYKGTSEELFTSTAYFSAILFPWPSRIRDGKYSFEGNNYQLPINEAKYNAAIHGLVADKTFEVININTDENEASIKLAYTYNGDLPGYPFPFTISVQYTLHINEGLKIEFEIHNIGTTNLPFGLGWHPYFEIEGESTADWNLKLPATHMYMLDNQMIPVGKGLYMYNNQEVSLANKSYDHVFLIDKKNKKSSIYLNSTKSGVTMEVWQDSGPKQFGFAVVYFPTGGSQIAIEPLSCNADAFNSKEGLNVLASGENFKLSCGVKLS
jgi:aldose 1-epimerase